MFRRRDPQAVADEIAHWHTRYGIGNFSFYDDALLVNPDEMILPLARDRPPWAPSKVPLSQRTPPPGSERRAEPSPVSVGFQDPAFRL